MKREFRSFNRPEGDRCTMCAPPDQETPKRAGKSSRGIPIIEVGRPSSRSTTVDAREISLSANTSIVTTASCFAETNCAFRMAITMSPPRSSEIAGGVPKREQLRSDARAGEFASDSLDG